MLTTKAKEEIDNKDEMQEYIKKKLSLLNFFSSKIIFSVKIASFSPHITILFNFIFKKKFTGKPISKFVLYFPEATL